MKEKYSFLSTKTKDTTRRAFNRIQILLREDANSYVLILSGWCKNEEYSNARSGIVIIAVLLLFVLLFTTAKLLSYATVYSSLYVEEGGAGPDGALGGGGRGGGGAPEGA